MMTYLDVALEHAEELLGFYADPAGLLYMHVHNPMIRPGDRIDSVAHLEDEIAKSYKMRGYLLERPEVVEGMDADIGQFFCHYSCALKNDGTFTKGRKCWHQKIYK